MENQIIRVGSVRFMEMENIMIPETIRQKMECSYLEGHSLVMVAVNRAVAK